MIDWTPIADVIPSKMERVILFAKVQGRKVYGLGELGPSDPSPIIRIPQMDTPMPRQIVATHWSRLGEPEDG